MVSAITVTRLCQNMFSVSAILKIYLVIGLFSLNTFVRGTQGQSPLSDTLTRGDAGQGEGTKDYNGWRIIRILPKRGSILQDLLGTLEKSGAQILHVSKVPLKVDVALPPSTSFEKLLSMADYPNLQAPSTRESSSKPMPKSREETRTLSEDLSRFLTWEDVGSVRTYAARQLNGSESFGWESYYRYDAISRFIKEVALRSPNAEYVEIGKSVEGRPLFGLLFGKKPQSLKRKYRQRRSKLRRLRRIRGRDLTFEESREKRSNRKGKGRPMVFIEAGIHANEWISPAVATYVADQLTHAGRTFFQRMTVIIVPMANPDGYEYSHERDNMWRKNRRQSKVTGCVGVDLNRNWGEGWGNTSGSSDDPCSLTYHGNKTFSEPETQAVRDFALAWTDQIVLHLSLHSYGGYILYPWYLKTTELIKKQEVHSIAKLMQKHLKRNGYRNIQVGQGSEVLYKAAGTIGDYLFTAGIQYTYTLELPVNEYAPNPINILPVSEAVFDAFICTAGDIVDKKKLKSYCGQRIVKLEVPNGIIVSMWFDKSISLEDAQQMVLEALESGNPSVFAGGTKRIKERGR